MLDYKAIVDQIKRALPLEKYIQDHLGKEIVKKGSTNLATKCFWHFPDDDPSFMISTTKLLGNCFVCQDKPAMDVVRLIQEIEHKTFEEAVLYGAALAGMPITEENSEEYEFASMYKDLFKHCAGLLISHVDIMAYLANRGINQDTIKTYNIGYAPNYGSVASAIPDKFKHHLPQYLFGDAIIYPLMMGGSPVGFYSRYMNPQSDMKFIGTSANVPLFNKARMFGSQIALRNMYKSSHRLIIVEGPNDVLALHSAGIYNVVSTLGARITEDQLAYFASCSVREIVYCPDGDNAGIESAKRLPESGQIAIKVALLPSMEDPDEFVKRAGADAFKELINGARFPVEFELDSILDSIGDSMTSKFDALKRIETMLKFKPIIMKSIYSKKIADKLQLDQAVVDDFIINKQITFNLYSLESERIVLGSAASDINVLATIVSKLKREDLSFTHQKLYDILANFDISRLTKISPMMVMESAAAMRVDLSVLTDVIYTGVGHDIEYHMSQIIENSSRRKLQSWARQVAIQIPDRKIAMESFTDGFMKVMSSQTGGFTITNASQQIAMTMDELHRRMQNPGVVSGLDLGEDWKHTTETLNGLCKGRLIVLAGSPRAGKSALALEWALVLAKRGIPVGWISLEMSELEMTQRALSKLTLIPNVKIQRGNLTSTEEIMIQDAALMYHGMPLYMTYEPNLTINDIVTVSKQFKMRYGIQALFIDYIQLIRPARGEYYEEGSFQRVGAISGALKSQVAGAKDMDIPVCAIAQLSRAAEGYAIPGGAQISESYKIFQDTDVFIGIKRSDEEGGSDTFGGKPNAIMNIDKNRGGADRRIIDYQFSPSTLKCRELAIVKP